MVSICETRPDGEEQPPSASGVQGSDRLPIVLTAHCGRQRIWVAASARRAGVRGPLGRMSFDALQQNAGACVNQFESFVMLRRLRAITITAGLWSLAFTLLSLLAMSSIAVVLYRVVPVADRPLLWSLLARTLAIWALTGFVTGIAFASIVMRFAGDNTSSRLSTRRFVMWGGAAGGVAPAVAVPLLAATHVMPASATVLLVLSGVCAIVGAFTARATLWVSRRGENVALPVSRSPDRNSRTPTFIG